MDGDRMRVIPAFLTYCPIGHAKDAQEYLPREIATSADRPMRMVFRSTKEAADGTFCVPVWFELVAEIGDQLASPPH
jgi:hypothetical protein